MNNKLEENIGIIYGHFCRKTKKWYVGQTTYTNPEKRWGIDGKGYFKGETKFAKAIKYYGWDSFDHIILEKCNINDLNEREKYWISEKDSFNNGYNSTIGGETLFSDDIKEKISKNRKGKCVGKDNPNFNKKFSDETKRRLSKSHMGHKPSKETREKMSKSHIGHIVSEKSRKALIEYNKHRIPIKMFGSKNPASKKLFLFNANTKELIKEYSAIVDFEADFNFSKTIVKKVIKNKFFIYDKLTYFVSYFKENNVNLPENILKVNKRIKYNRAVIMKDYNTGEILQVFPSIKDAQNTLKLPGLQHISACCNKKRKTSGILNGKILTWEYDE